jgi:hypothetical protein
MFGRTMMWCGIAAAIGILPVSKPADAGFAQLARLFHDWIEAGAPTL